MDTKPDNLTEMQEMFCQYYVATNNGKTSAIKAGYSEGSAHVSASRLLKDAKIEKRISQLRSKVMEDLDMSKEQVVNWLYDIANPINREPTGNRLKALEMLGKYHAIFTEKKTVETTANINVVDYSQMTDEQILDSLKLLEENTQ